MSKIRGRGLALTALAWFLAVGVWASSGSSLGPRAVLAASIQVETTQDERNFNGSCSLREAVINANENNQAGSTDCPSGAGADVIVLEDDGEYALTLGSGDADAEEGDLDILSDITIEVDGEGSASIQAGFAGGDRVFHVFAGAKLTLIGITVTGGVINGPGAGINNVDGEVVLDASIVTGNTATGNGAGIRNQRGTVTLINGSRVTNNTASGNGGGVLNNDGTVRLTDAIVTGNQATNGGGIYTEAILRQDATLLITESVISMNVATDNGGGIFNLGDHVEITRSSINENDAGILGGGIYAEGLDLPQTLLVSASTIAGNTASAGGALFNYGDVVEIDNSTISGNVADFGGGGGLFNHGIGGTIRLINVTIAFNESAELSPNSGIHNDGVATSVVLLNSVVAENIPVDCTGEVTSEGNNLDGDGSCLDGSEPGDIPNGAANLGGLADNGGPTRTHALLTGSGAIDAGNNAACGNPPVSGADQRRVIRPLDGDGNGSAICDIGAYEAPALEPTPMPTPIASSTPTHSDRRPPNIGGALAGLFGVPPTPPPTATQAAAVAGQPAIRPPNTGDAGIR